MKLTNIHTIAFEAAKEASVLIMEIFNEGDFETQVKKDNSLLTKADLESSRIIIERLKKTGISILSEEDESNEFSKRKDWDLMWVVDPLDGTWGFVHGKKEFTVNIGLVKNGKPIFGVIAVPATQEIYFGGGEFGAFRFNFSNQSYVEAIKLPIYSTPEDTLVVTGGGSIPPSFFEDFRFITKKYDSISFIKVASALKFCLIAEGKMDVYPRNYPCMEWDTAAGHAIINGVGKELYDSDTSSVISYNREDLHVPFFILT